ncbi:MAG TPA: AAA family ATPase [Povalibacter sp.]|uniref:AAA family ATPase n=1 Tax=Povalibacter sp. TaxID=1962978 RepID=UPI002B55A6BE|nr:AAA family ATPase [Povalibacter sp.]HMN43333.1 AAA family ATPase [Povalibacter sp.]
MTSRSDIDRLQKLVEASILGQQELIRSMIIGLLADGHLLLESLPGLAKTRAVKSLAKSLTADMRRIQFTPDLLPADITGTEVLHQQDGKNVFQFQPGPIFGNVILADEINRAPAKVQSALLEAMEERQITVAGTTHPMPDLFIVLATQNPIEQEGTYPLPEAQTDRFLMKVLIDYPDPASEVGVLQLNRKEEIEKTVQASKSKDAAAAPAKADTVSQDSIFAARREINAIHVAAAIEQYIIDLLNATRHPDQYGDKLKKWLQIGSSPRGGISLDRASRVNAWLEGRDHVTPDDVRSVVHPVLRHRLILSYDANADGVGADQVIDELVKSVAVPA